MSHDRQIDRIVRAALKEDLAGGDVTTDTFVPPTVKAKGALIFREPAVVCGLPVVQRVFAKVDRRLVFKYQREDGDRVDAGATVAVVLGRARSILRAERTAVNFLQRLSGIATLSRAFVDAFPGVKVHDTRKTTPGLRVLEKEAVRVGGGHNHRADLSQIMIKDNHIVAAGEDAVALQLAAETRDVIIEATTAAMAIRWAGFSCVKRILLDNMGVDAVPRIRAVNSKVILELTGGVTLKTRVTGVDAVSVGALTHSARAIDAALELTRL